MTRTVRTVSDATFVDVVLGCATTCVVGFHGPNTTAEDEQWMETFAQANRWISCAHLDVSANPQTAQTYAVPQVPLYVIFRRGAVMSSLATTTELAAYLDSGQLQSLETTARAD